MGSSEEQKNKRQAAKEVIDLLEEIAMLLDTGLSRAQLSLCVSMIENGVNPEALATVITNIRREAKVLEESGHGANSDSDL